MNSSSASKHQAALSIEELVQNTENQQQNWLLTYLDVFVLIIMLVVTLIALSNFESEQQSKHPQLKKNTKKNLPIKVIDTIQPLKTTPLKEPEQINNQQKIPAPQNHQMTTLPEQTLAEEKTEHLKISEKKPEKKTTQSLNKDTFQQQLNKTVEDMGLIDAVKMKVSLGYAQLEIQDKILFNSSEASLLTAGQSLLKKLIPLLNQSSGLIYIEGHTDNRPIKTARFPSNWELGAARATSVLHYLASQKLDAARLRAVTYGDTKPVADNTTKEGREKNRRVSMIIKVSDKVD